MDWGKSFSGTFSPGLLQMSVEHEMAGLSFAICIVQLDSPFIASGKQFCGSGSNDIHSSVVQLKENPFS